MVAVTVIDHGAGNLRSVIRALSEVGATVTLTNDIDRIRTAGHLVVPGQGAFGDCMTRMQATGLDVAIREHVASGKPYLGICLGLQVLFETGLEHGTWEGLGVFAGTCERIPASAEVKVPHMGWSQLGASTALNVTHPWLRPLSSGWFYFVHSYRVLPAAGSSLECLTVEHGGQPIVAAVARDNVMACQVHPEKSHRDGLALLGSFLKYA